MILHLVDATLCPLCACVPKKNYQWPQPYPLSWDGDDEEDGAAGAVEQLLLEVLRGSVILELRELQLSVQLHVVQGHYCKLTPRCCEITVVFFMILFRYIF